jgi:hypothetical protein
MAFKLPSDSQRTVVIGRTGSGKTQFAAWLLSQKSFARRPFFILDFKLDELLNDIPGVKEHTLGDKLPKKPGLYITHPMTSDEEKLEKFLWDIWNKGNAGLFLDETMMVDKNSHAFRAILTQGRSKKIPVIMCTQRPVDISRFCFSESEFKCLFDLDDERDKKTVREFMPIRNKAGKIMRDVPPLPAYHGYWYDSTSKETTITLPAPSKDEIHHIFRQKLSSPRHAI